MKTTALTNKTSLSLVSKAAGLALLAFFILPFTGCKKEDTIVNKSFHFEEMGQALEDQFGPGCVGFQYTIAHKGAPKVSDAIGKAGLASNGVDIDYTETHRKSVHSCSKTITAAALMHALTINNVNPGASIADYLPGRWDTSNVDEVTFLQLMRHESGFRGTRDTYTSMKNYIQDSAFSSKVYTYANVNYSLMRILIPNIDPASRAQLETIYQSQGETEYNEEVSERYIQYVRDNVLVPSGVSSDVGPLIWDAAQIATPTYNYNFADQSIAGYAHSDQTLLTGAGGWYMNAYEYAGFLAYLTEGELANINMQTMMDFEYGMFDRNRNGVTYYTHNGAFTGGDGRGGRAIWVYIPSNKVIVTVQINSGTNAFSIQSLENAIIDEYQDSYY